MLQEDKMLEGCRHGKREAQAELYRKFTPVMFGVCLRYSRNSTEAEDILQEGFVRVFSHIRAFKGTGSLEGWIRKIMMNTAVNFIRKRNRIILFEESSLVNTPEDNDRSPWYHDAVSPELLIETIQSLPAGYRMVLNLFVFENLSHRDIAGMLGISENTSKTQYFKAKSLLKKKLLEHMKKNYNIAGYEK